MTYSILGFDPSCGDLGIAVQSKFPGVGGLVPYGEAGVGVVATQAFANPRHGSVGLSLLKCGATPQQAVDILLSGDDQTRKRQFALLDGNGPAAVHTGADLGSWDGWSGSATGDCCNALGNGLAGGDVVRGMVGAFQQAAGPLAERLMTALQAGEQAGGDIRGLQSAALLVLRRNGGYGSLDDRHVVISIYDHQQPIEELQRCYALHRLSYFPSEPENLVPIGPDLAMELKGLMTRRGFYSGVSSMTVGTAKASDGWTSSWAARITTIESRTAACSIWRCWRTCASDTVQAEISRRGGSGRLGHRKAAQPSHSTRVGSPVWCIRLTGRISPDDVR